MKILSFKYFSIALASVWLIIFTLFPNFFILIVSFLERDEINFIKPVATLDNFKTLADPIFLSIFIKSLYLSSVTTLLCLILSYPFVLITSKFTENMKKILLLLVIIPFWTSSLIRTYALITILKANGVINSLLISLHIIDAPMNILYTDVAVFIGLTYTLLPFMIIPLFVSVDNIDYQLIEAAYDLGAGKIRTLYSIIIPLTLPGIIAGCVLVFLPSLGLFYIPDILGGSKSMLIGNLIKNQFLITMNWPLGSSISILLNLVLGILLFIYYKSLRRLNKIVTD